MYPTLFEEYLELAPELLSNDAFIDSPGSAYEKIRTLEVFSNQIDYLDKEGIIEAVYEDIENVEDLGKFSEYIANNPEIGFVIDKTVKNRVRSIIDEEMDDLQTEDELDMEKYLASEIFTNLGMNGDDIISKIEDKIESIRQEDDFIDYPDDYDGGTLDEMRDAEIISLFQSLRDSGS